MKISKINSIYFSPTESTQGILKVMTGVMKKDKEEESINITEYEAVPKKYEFNGDEAVIIGVPSYGGRVPAPAVERLKAIKGNNTPAVLVVSYGNRAYDDTLLELKNIVAENGFVVVAAGAFITQHSIMPSFGSGRPDDQDRKEIEEFAKKALEKIEDGDSDSHIWVPGNMEYRKYNGVPLKPKAGKKCDKCGICVNACPVNAISKENPMETDSEKCITCARCIAVCPKKARSLNKAMLFVATNQMKKECSEHKKNEIYL